MTLLRRARAPVFLLGVSIVGCGACQGSDDPKEPTPENPDANVSVQDASSDKTPVGVDGGKEASVFTCDASDCEHAVFVTKGTFAGTNVKDTNCEDAAAASTLPRIKGHKFKAWISTSAEPAKNRHQHSTLRYLKVKKNGSSDTVAPNWDGLTSGALTAAIDLDENGDAVDGGVWTGSDPAGGVLANCQDWTGGANGRVGESTSTDIRWTNSRSGDCTTTSLHIYCIEVTQP